MESEHTERAAFPCAHCGRPFNVPVDRKLRVTCPYCGSKFDLDTHPRRAPALWFAGWCGALWSIAVLPLAGTEIGTYAAVVASMVARYAVGRARQRWRAPLYDEKPLAAAGRLFNTMIFVAIPFAALATYLHLGAESWLGHVTLAGLLRLKLLLARFDTTAQVEAVGASLVIGLALLAIAAWLNGDSAGMGRLKAFKERAGEVSRHVTVVLLCLGSFSIVGGAAGVSLLHLTQAQAEHELAVIAKDLDRLEQGLRVVFGERLAAQLINANPKSEPTAAPEPAELEPAELKHKCAEDQDPDATCSASDLASHLQSLEKAADPSMANADTPFGAEVATVAEPFEKRAASPPTARPRGDLGTFAEDSGSEIRAATDTFCKASRCARTTEASDLRELVGLIIEVGTEWSGVSFPKLGKERLGEFATSLFGAVSRDPLKDIANKWVTAKMVAVIHACQSATCKIVTPLGPEEVSATAGLRPAVKRLAADLAVRVRYLRRKAAEASVTQPPDGSWIGGLPDAVRRGSSPRRTARDSWECICTENGVPLWTRYTTSEAACEVFRPLCTGPAIR